MLTSVITFAGAYASLHLNWVQRLWDQLLDSHGQSSVVTVLIPWAIGVVVYWVFGIAMLVIEMQQRPRIIFDRKIQPHVTLQTKGSSWQPPLLHCCRVVLFNQFFVLLPTLFAIDFFCRGFSGIRVERSLPSPQRMICDAAASGLLVEVFFYLSHRLLHTRYFYRYHKLHHSYKAPIALAALYAHPVEAMLGNTIAVMAPAYVAGIHGYSWMWGVALGFVSTQAKHSGFAIDGVSHDRHHQFSNVEYGHFGVMDFIFGTSYSKLLPLKGQDNK